MPASNLLLTGIPHINLPGPKHRAMVEVKALANKDLLIEIEAVAVIP